MQLVDEPLEAFCPPGLSLRAAATRDEAKAKARQAIEAAAQALREGEDFGEVAKRHSRGVKAAGGGLWPPMPAGSFRQRQVEQVAFRLAEGQVSDIVETEDGYYIIKAYKVVQGRRASFEDAQPEIDRIIREQQFRRLSQDYFRRLQMQAALVDYGQLVDLATDRAMAQYGPPPTK